PPPAPAPIVRIVRFVRVCTSAPPPWPASARPHPPVTPPPPRRSDAPAPVCYASRRRRSAPSGGDAWRRRDEARVFHPDADAEALARRGRRGAALPRDARRRRARRGGRLPQLLDDRAP